MFAASLRLRLAAALAASTLATLYAAAGSAQPTIDLSLNVVYTNPATPALGGIWELVGKTNASPTTFGISGISANLANVNNDVTLIGPRGFVNGTDKAGFQILSNTAHGTAGPTPAYQEIVVAQLPLFQLPANSEENLFYGVGNLANGAPNYPGKGGANATGPAFASLTSPQGIPWASTPDFKGDNTWDIAAHLLSGTFTGAAAPAFVTGTLGNVFVSMPLTNNAIGNEDDATVNAIVRILVPPAANSADYNHDGIVDARDYVLWRKTNGSTATPPGSGADGNGDGTVNLADYTLWVSHFGNPSGSGAGGGLSSGAVPEPTGCVLLTFGALLIFARRQGRFQYQVNN